MSPPSLFHPAVAAWFERSFRGPTVAQTEAWPAIKASRNVLIAAPTGSGKTGTHAPDRAVASDAEAMANALGSTAAQGDADTGIGPDAAAPQRFAAPALTRDRY
jgi:DEAD/DEAH box helicase